MELTQSEGPEGVQVLPADDDAFTTGPMSDCISVIILHTPVQGIYQHGRGQHGSGGIENVHFPTLLQGVPNNANTQVIVVPGHFNTSEFRVSQITEIVNEALAAANLDQVNVRILTARPSATVDRRGTVS